METKKFKPSSDLNVVETIIHALYKRVMNEFLRE